MRDVAQGTHLIDIGQRTDGFFILLSGVVVLTVISFEGDCRVIDIIHPGRSFGEALVFLNEPSPVQAEMKQSGKVMMVPAPSVNRLIPESQAVARRMISGLSVRLHKLIFDIESCSLHRSRQRVIGYLLGEADEQGPGGGAMELQLPVSKKIIASKLDLTAETFSRVLHELTLEGLIKVDRRRIDIPDRDALRRNQALPI